MPRSVRNRPAGQANGTLRRFRLVGWNVGLALFGLALVAAVGEIYLRLTVPFMTISFTKSFVPGVGFLIKPNSEVKTTDQNEFWTVSQANSLGFLDREPPSPERAEESCHIAVLGDSFVEAAEVPINDKMQVRLEELAQNKLPDLDVTTSAFGIASAAQVTQLPFYDHYARNLRPDLLVLVFSFNDFSDNFSLFRYTGSQWDPDHPPSYYAKRSTSGKIELHPPDPNYASYKRDLWNPFAIKVFPDTFLGTWLNQKLGPVHGNLALLLHQEPHLFAQDIDSLLRRTHYAALADSWTPTTRGALWLRFLSRDPPPVVQEALDFTEFGLDEFKKRADNDHFSLLILATHTLSDLPEYLRAEADWSWFDLLNDLVKEKGIPVIDQSRHILQKGRNIEEAYFSRNGHWNELGHQWAAETIFAYLKQNQDVCDGYDAY